MSIPTQSDDEARYPRAMSDLTPILALTPRITTARRLALAWGVVPVHLNELSPPDFRGTFPGLVYQLGNFAAAYAAQQQAWLAEQFRLPNGRPNYALTMAMVQSIVFVAVIVLAAIGPEKRGKEF